MNEEWLWNNEKPSAEFEPKKEDAVEEVKAEATVEENKVEKTEQTYHWVNPKVQHADSEQTAGAENSYSSENYREPIIGGVGSESANAASQNADTVDGQQSETMDTERTNTAHTNTGYYGGPYHGDWRTQHAMNQEARRQESANQDTGRTEEDSAVYHSYPIEDTVSEGRTKGKNRFGKKLMRTVATAAVFGLVAGSVMFGVNTLANHFWGDDTKPEENKQVPTVQLQQGGSSNNGGTSNTDASSGYGFTVKEVAENCMPSVVSITCASVTKVQSYFGSVQEIPSESSGSGIIVGQNETELLIATNNHVIEGAETVTVAFFDDEAYPAQKKGSASDTDLAVLAVRLSDMKPSTIEAIRIIRIGNEEDIEIGDQVVAIGNALGYGQSVTSGWVSAVNRSVEDENGNVTDSLIQTDAAINPGNSGGALLNMRGELIGINSAKTADTKVEGMGYAISIGKAEPILNELMNIKTRYKVDESEASYIGVTCYNVESIATQMYGIPSGAFIDSVTEGGPSDKAGMRKGDVVIKFDNQKITSSTGLVELLEYYAAGEVVELVVARAEQGEYKEVTLTITLGHKSQMETD